MRARAWRARVYSEGEATGRASRSRIGGWVGGHAHASDSAGAGRCAAGGENENEGIGCACVGGGRVLVGSWSSAAVKRGGWVVEYRRRRRRRKRAASGARCEGGQAAGQRLHRQPSPAVNVHAVRTCRCRERRPLASPSCPHLASGMKRHWHKGHKGHKAAWRGASPHPAKPHSCRRWVAEGTTSTTGHHATGGTQPVAELATAPLAVNQPPSTRWARCRRGSAGTSSSRQWRC